MAEETRAVCVGILVADLFCSPLQELPQAGELKLVSKISLNTGGCAANTAIGLAKMGIKVEVMGGVGRDSFGEFIIKDLAWNGVKTTEIKISESFATSNTIVIPTLHEDRRYIHTFGANADFGINDINFDHISKTKVLYVGGYLDLPKFDQNSLIKVLKFAQEKGVTTAVDVIIPGKERNPQYFKECRDALGYIDVFLPNYDEARLLTNEEIPEKQAEVLLRFGPKMVLITMGQEGVVFKTEKQTIVASAYKVDSVDPSGGGDAFDAGFILGLIEAWPIDYTLKFASAMGASCVRKLGCTAGLFAKEEAIRFIKNNELKLAIKS